MDYTIIRMNLDLVPEWRAQYPGLTAWVDGIEAVAQHLRSLPELRLVDVDAHIAQVARRCGDHWHILGETLAKHSFTTLDVFNAYFHLGRKATSA